jgi:hypothetical protein
MPVKQQIPYSNGHFFITFTCYNWLPLIEVTNGYDIVYKWFDYLKQQGHYITGYIIMHNHLHATIAFRECGKSINSIIGNGKRFIAYEIIERLKTSNETAILQQLATAVNSSDRKRGKKHEVWEDSFDWKECNTEHFTNQKLNYMHLNACRGNYMLAPTPEKYLHSSAKYYATGVHAAYEVTDYTLILHEIDLTKAMEKK